MRRWRRSRGAIWTSSDGCSTPLTLGCATAMRCRRRRSRRPCGGASDAGALGARIMGGGLRRPRPRVAASGRAGWRARSRFGPATGRGCYDLRAWRRRGELRPTRWSRWRAAMPRSCSGAEARAAMERSAAVVGRAGGARGAGVRRLDRVRLARDGADPRRAPGGAAAGAGPLARRRDGPAGRARGRASDDAAASALAGDGVLGGAAGGRRGDARRCSTPGSRRSCPSTGRSAPAATSRRSRTARWR